MILRLIFSVYFINIVRAVEWQPQSFGGAPPAPYLTSDTSADSKPDFSMGYNSFYDNVQVPGKHSHLLEIQQNTKCYTIKSMMKMVQGILGYLVENPNKLNYLHHLISFLKDDDENTLDAYDSNHFGEIFRRIDIDDSLPQQEKQVLRALLNIDAPKPDMQTTIVFKYQLPSLNQPQCKTVFMKLLEVAHESYLQLSKYPTCEIQPGYIYDNSNIGQPEIPKINTNFPKILEPSGKQPDKDTIGNFYIDWTEEPYVVKPSENWPLIFTDNPIIQTTPKAIEVEPPKTVLNLPNGAIPTNELMKYLLLILTENNVNSYQNFGVFEKLIQLIKSNEQDVSYSQILALIELLRKSNAGQRNPKLIEIILPLLLNTKTVPDPKVFKILIGLLKPNVNGVVNPKMIELILALLKLNKDEMAKEKYQILLSLLNPDENGEVNPKLIEIISFLLNVNQNSPPNNEIIQVLVSFLNLGNKLNSRNIDTLLYLLKLNNNHKLPEQLYQKIIQFLLKININKKSPSMNSFHFYYPMLYPDKLQNIDGKLLAVLFAKNPNLFYKLLPNPYATMPNQLNPNAPGIIELTYLLKHPKPFVYQPFYYVKYRLPFPTFVTNVKNLLQKDPLLTTNPTKLYQNLITISNVTEISPNLKGYSKEDILKLTFDNGALIKTKIMDDKNINFKEQIALLQNLNSDVQPESILEQSDRVMNDQQFKDETQKLDQFWKLTHPDNVDTPLLNSLNSQLPGSRPGLKDSPFYYNSMPLNKELEQREGLFDSSPPLKSASENKMEE